jgi:hypothetical protein
VSTLIMALGVIMVLIAGAIGISPAWFFALADWEAQGGLYIAAAIRIISGVVLILGASASRYPKGLRIFGAVVLLAGVLILFTPLDLWAGLMRWVTVEHSAVFRVGGGVGGAVLGLFLIHAAKPKRTAAELSS